MSDQSIRRMLALALTGLILETPLMPLAGAEKVSLFKIVTIKDDIIIGLSDDEIAKLDSKDAGGVAKMLVAKGSMTAWQYAVRKGASGDLEQAPLRKVALISHDSVRVESYATPLKVLPIEEFQK